MSLTSYRAAPPRANTTLSVDLILKKEPPGSGQAQYTRQQRDKVYPFTSYRFRRPGSDLLSRALRQSTIGAASFHDRVRNGVGWDTCAITTWSSSCMKRCNRRAWRRCGGKTSNKYWVACKIVVRGIRLCARLIKPIERLVPVSFTHYCASTPGLSTWWSSTVLKRILVSRGASRLDAFSGYPFRT